MNKWTIGDIIRYIRNAHPYLVVQILEPCTMVVDLNAQERLSSTLAILQRDYDDFVPEKEMRDFEHHDIGETTLTWEQERQLQWV